MVDRTLPNATVVMSTLKDSELVVGTLAMVSLIAVMLSGLVVVGGRLVAVASDAALAERLNTRPGLLNAAAIAAARLPAAGSFGGGMGVDTTVTAGEELLVVTTGRDGSDCWRADVLVLKPTGVGMINSRTVFVPKGFAAMERMSAASKKTTKLYMFRASGLCGAASREKCVCVQWLFWLSGLS